VLEVHVKEIFLGRCYSEL